MLVYGAIHVRSTHTVDALVKIRAKLVDSPFAEFLFSVGLAGSAANGSGACDGRLLQD
jgi:hypothetical protein